MNWKPIEKYNGLYLISDDGKVFSVRNGRLLKVNDRGNGYMYIEINVNGKAKKEAIHRLVAEAFIPNPNNYPVVNHKDENPKNNNVDNLEWCTYQYNTNYGTCRQKISLHSPNKKGDKHPKSLKVYQYDLLGNFVAEYGSVREAARITGFANSSIASCANGRLKQSNGFVWSYKKEFRGYTSEVVEKFKKGAFLMYDLDGNYIRRFDNSKEMKDAGFNQISANRVVRGERKSYKGFVFKHEGVQ